MLQQLLRNFAQADPSSDVSQGYVYDSTPQVGDINHAHVAMVVVGIVAVILLISLPAIIGAWKTFRKAGEHGWAAIIPFYSTWVSYRIGGLNPQWSLLLVPYFLAIYLPVFMTVQDSAQKLLNGLTYLLLIVVVVLQARAAIGIAKRFGKDAVFGFFLLFILPFIGYPILGFGTARYNDGNKPKAKAVRAKAAAKPRRR